jgi:hypothetical protein
MYNDNIILIDKKSGETILNNAQSHSDFSTSDSRFKIKTIRVTGFKQTTDCCRTGNNTQTLPQGGRLLTSKVVTVKNVEMSTASTVYLNSENFSSVCSSVTSSVVSSQSSSLVSIKPNSGCGANLVSQN